MRLERRDWHVRAKLEEVRPAERGEKNGSAIGHVGFETVVSESRGRDSCEVAIAWDSHLFQL